MSKVKDLTGMKFGRLTAIKIIGQNEHKSNLWLCECDCGNQCITYTTQLLIGKTKSCGCLQKENFLKSVCKHNLSNSRIYKIWTSIKQRCNGTTLRNKKYYKDKNILVCDEWKNNFIEFYNWSIANGYKEGLTIDRINSNGNYEPNNCRWVDRTVQNNNTSRNKIIEFNNEKHTMAEWSRILNIDYYALQHRIKRGWSTERAFTEPVKRRKNDK